MPWRGWPVGSAAAGVVASGPGPAPTEVAEQTGDLDTPFPWASVTKLLVAMAVLVATEEGTVGLDDGAGPPGSTVRHLLAHASGLGPDAARPLTAPGRRRIYSNVGYEVLAAFLARRSGMPFTDYLRTGVVHPLDMTGTELPAGSSPASGARGPLRDLLALAGELLAPRLVSPATLDGATAVAFPGLAGVLPGFGRFDPCDWGLGFELARRQGAALDRDAQLAGHLRPLRAVRRLRLGRPPGRGGVRGAVRPGLRPVGDRGLAGPRRRRDQALGALIRARAPRTGPPGTLA